MMTNPKGIHQNLEDHIDSAGSGNEKEDEFCANKTSADNVENRRTIVSTGKKFNSCDRERQSGAVTGQCGRRRDERQEEEEEAGDSQDRVSICEVAMMNEKKRQAELERAKQALDARRKEKRKELVKLVSPLGELDSTEDVSCLSTIIEETENNSSSYKDTVDMVTSRDRDKLVALEDSKESSLSPFPESNIDRRKVGETDLATVRHLMARVKMQGKVLEKSDTHFMTVEGRPGDKETNHSAAFKPYKINQQFVQRVLEFSSSSLVCSSSLSSSNSSKHSDSGILKPAEFKRPVAPKSFPKPLKSSKPASKPKRQLDSVVTHKENDKTEVFAVPGSTNPDQPQLRYYIEKLLNLRQEDIRNLSVSSCTTPERPIKTNTKKKNPPSSSLSLSSTSCSLQKSLGEDSQAIQSLYYSTRQQLLSKLSSVAGGQGQAKQQQHVEWSSFDLSSVEGGESSSGTITSIHLSTTEYDSW